MLAAAFVSLPLSVFAETELIEAKVVSVGQSSFLVEMNAARTEIAIDKKSRFWMKRLPAQAQHFSPGDKIVAKIAQVNSRWTFRECADPFTADWLDFIRHALVPAKIIGGDPEGIRVRFADGAYFRYDLMPSTKVKLGGADASRRDLQVGQIVFIKSRLSSTGETSASLISDSPSQKEIKKGSKVDSISGIIEEIDKDVRWISIRYDDDLKIQVALSDTSKFWLDFNAGKEEHLKVGTRVVARVKKDSSGVFELLEIHGFASP